MAKIQTTRCNPPPIRAKVTPLPGQETRELKPAYSGGYLDVDGYAHPVVVDVESASFEPEMNCLLTHEPAFPIGWIGEPKKVMKKGVHMVHAVAVIGGTPFADEYFRLQREAGLKFKPSIGVYHIREGDTRFVPAGQKMKCNGEQWLKGPFFYVTNAVIKEISMVLLAGDAAARSVLAASLKRYGENTMRTDEFYAWLLATKEMTREDFDALTEEEKAALDVEFGAIEAELDDEGSPDVIGDITVEDSEEFFGWLGAVYELNEEAFLALPIEEQQAYRDEYELSKAEPEPVQAKGKKFPKRDSSGEIVRCNQIKAAFGDDPAFCRRAIAAGWNVKRAVKIFDAQVKAKRQRRSNVPVTAGSSGPMGGGNKRDIAVVSLARTFGITDDRVCDKFFGKDKRRFESAVKAAISRGCYDGGYSLNDLYLDAINSTARKLTEPLLNEARLVAFRNRQSVAGRPGAVKASLGFSTIDGDEVLTGVMQAYLEERWAAYELQYPQVAKEREVANFRDIEGYRTTLMGRIGQIAANGQIPMLGLDIEKTVSKALPQGATFAVPKMHYIDDDIGLFQDIADQIADVSWQSLESDVFEMLRLMMAGEVNASDGLPFFSVDRGNMITGATSSLSVTGLGLVKAAFAKLRNKNGQPIAFKPDRLVVPPALEDIAERIYTSTESMAPDPNGSRQVYYNQYRPVSTPYLGSSNDTGNISDLAWVLMLDPERFPVIAVQKLRGYTTPVIEQSDMDLAVWGTKFRTLFPYGVTPGFPEAAVLATGEA